MRRIARTAADGVGAREWLEMGGEKKPLVMSELGCALEMGGEKKPLGMGELGCADGCGRQMGGENCADSCGRRGYQGVAGNDLGEEAAGDERAWLRGGCGRQMGGENCADGVGAREWLEMGREKKPLEISELGCARGRLRTAWVQGIVGRRSRW